MAKQTMHNKIRQLFHQHWSGGSQASFGRPAQVNVKLRGTFTYGYFLGYEGKTYAVLIGTYTTDWTKNVGRVYWIPAKGINGFVYNCHHDSFNRIWNYKMWERQMILAQL